MIQKILHSLFGSRNERLLKKLYQQVAQINALEPEYQALSNEALLDCTRLFKERFEKGTTLEQLLPEAFAAVREAGRRTLGMRHFDVQLIGGMVLHQGKIAEMSTGEGKTLMATLAAYLNALSGKSVHIVTVNEYLVKRDAAWMAPLYAALGLTVGVVVPNQPRPEKQAAYKSDIVYATNNELGFDYLRDRMAYHPNEQVQGFLGFAIVDEVDSILIDEARTPLIISGAAEDSSSLYREMNNRVIPALTLQSSEEIIGDYSLDEKSKQAFLTETGHQKVEHLLTELGLLKAERGLYDPVNIGLMHHVNAALRAHALFRRDVDYIVLDDQVVIVDEHTGRTMPGRRWSDGLHQAIEAKEGVTIQQESQTLASITFQNFFRLYQKLSGMTGTADTEAYEFQQIYGLEVVVIPTNKPCQRKDNSDLIYLTTEEKFTAIVKAIEDSIARGQPVLVGTISIETSEYLSNILKKKHIKHSVLNAKYHEQEATIIADAGRPGSVTIATNMAGRGTDIVLGGSLSTELKAGDFSEKQQDQIREAWQKRHDAVLDAGGLLILGTERHESRRIDNQLRGRSGRQGDQGASQFYLCLEDNLMRIFASDRLSGVMRKLGVQKGEAITHPWVTRAIENAQRKVEGHHFDIRKQLLQYDDVANEQRKAIYHERDGLLASESVSDTIEAMREEVVTDLVKKYIPDESVEELWDVAGLEAVLQKELGITISVQTLLESNRQFGPEEIVTYALETLKNIYHEKQEKIGQVSLMQLEKSVLLHALDVHWKEHLAALEGIRQSIHLRGYAQKDPKQEYKREAFNLFGNMLERIRHDVISALSRLQLNPVEVSAAPLEESLEERHLSYEHPPVAAPQPAAEKSLASRLQTPLVGRNEPCPCGSMKKFKYCHGALV